MKKFAQVISFVVIVIVAIILITSGGQMVRESKEILKLAESLR